MAEVRYIGLAALKAKARKAVKAATVQSANHLLADVVPATPIETGALRGSEQVGELHDSGDEITIKVFTGGEASDYAIPVHERPANHAEGGIHYIEGPLVRNGPLYREAMQRASKAAF